MRLVVAAHWDEGEPTDLDAVQEALAPLKAPGTRGYVIVYPDGDPQATRFYNAMKTFCERENQSDERT